MMEQKNSVQSILAHQIKVSAVYPLLNSNDQAMISNASKENNPVSYNCYLKLYYDFIKVMLL